MPLHLISRRFLFSPLLLRPLGLNTGTLRFNAYNYRSTSQTIDIYYDTAPSALSSCKISLHTRNGIWQLKQRILYSTPQKLDHLHENNSNYLSTCLWKELTDRREIMRFMGYTLGKEGQGGGVVANTLTFSFALKVVSELEMTRISYVVDNEWTVNLDHVMGSGYQVGKVETELGRDIVNLARGKLRGIEGMMNRYKWFFRAVPDPEGGVNGKMCA